MKIGRLTFIGLKLAAETRRTWGRWQCGLGRSTEEVFRWIPGSGRTTSRCGAARRVRLGWWPRAARPGAVGRGCRSGNGKGPLVQAHPWRLARIGEEKKGSWGAQEIVERDRKGLGSKGGYLTGERRETTAATANSRERNCQPRGTILMGKRGERERGAWGINRTGEGNKLHEGFAGFWRGIGGVIFGRGLKTTWRHRWRQIFLFLIFHLIHNFWFKTPNQVK